MNHAETFTARAALADQVDRSDAAHMLRLAAVDMGVQFATQPHSPDLICGKCGEPALADGSKLGGVPICGADLDDYYVLRISHSVKSHQLTEGQIAAEERGDHCSWRGE